MEFKASSKNDQSGAEGWSEHLLEQEADAAIVHQDREEVVHAVHVALLQYLRGQHTSVWLNTQALGPGLHSI